MSENDKIVSQGVSYLPNELLARQDGERLVASTLLNNCFLPNNRVPKKVLDQMTSNPEALEKQITAQMPLNQLSITKPYWTKGNNKRDYDRVLVEIYGALALSDDRHCLDSIIAWGALITNASKFSLREIAENFIGMDVKWDYFQDQSIIDNKLSNQGVYFHVKINDVLEAMKLTKSKANRNRILERLHRLSVMMLKIRFEKEGKIIPERSKNIRLVDKDFFPLLDVKKVRNKSAITSDTFTDIIINVSGFYLDSLTKEGQISRKRFMQAYPDLVGPNSVVDLFKFIDDNKREYLHGKWLSDVVFSYLESKVTLYGINLSLKCNDLMKEVINMQEAFKIHFNFILEQEHNPKKRIRGVDYRIYFLPKLNGQ